MNECITERWNFNTKTWWSKHIRQHNCMGVLAWLEYAQLSQSWWSGAVYCKLISIAIEVLAATTSPSPDQVAAGCNETIYSYSWKMVLNCVCPHETQCDHDRAHTSFLSSQLGKIASSKIDLPSSRSRCYDSSSFDLSIGWDRGWVGKEITWILVTMHKKGKRIPNSSMVCNQNHTETISLYSQLSFSFVFPSQFLVWVWWLISLLMLQHIHSEGKMNNNILYQYIRSN